MNEQWALIPGLINFSASNFGNVRNIVTKHILKPSRQGQYLAVHISENGQSKVMKVHRLVCMAFHPNTMNCETVDHIDRNTFNNRAENLRWATQTEQNQNKIRKKTGYRNGRKVIQMNATDSTIIRIYDSLEHAAKETGLSKSNICNVCKGKLNTTGGFKWSYVTVGDDDDEQWKDYPFLSELGSTWKGLQISSKGRTRITADLKDWRILNNSQDGAGYIRLTYDKNRSIAVHILVARTFLPPPEIEQAIVNHIDHDRRNNSVRNLEWLSRTDNNLHSYYSENAVRSDTTHVHQLDTERKLVKQWSSIASAANYHQVHHSSIHKVLNTQYKCKGYFWVRHIARE